MPHPPKSPDSPDLTLICGLCWPKRMERYYLSRRYPGCWDFWVLAPGRKKARQRFARLAEAHTAEEQVAFDMLDFFLQKYHPRTRPKERLRKQSTARYCDMFGMLADCMDHDEFDELMREVARGQEPEKPPARVLPFPPKDSGDGISD
jgi:hypothetical protein